MQEEYKADHKIEAPEEMERFDKFYKYLRANGAKFDKFKVRYYGPGWRGMHASRDIEKGELVLLMPKNLLIHTDQVEDSQVIKDINNIPEWKPLREKSNFDFAIWILQEEKKPDTPYKTYFDTMPTSYDSFPMFYTEEEIKLGGASQLIGDIGAYQ